MLRLISRENRSETKVTHINLYQSNTLFRTTLLKRNGKDVSWSHYSQRLFSGSFCCSCGRRTNRVCRRRTIRGLVHKCIDYSFCENFIFVTMLVVYFLLLIIIYCNKTNSWTHLCVTSSCLGVLRTNYIILLFCCCLCATVLRKP